MSASALFVVITTDASCGAVNAMHDSFMPLAGMVPMLNIQLGEVIFGGVGAGLYGMLMFAILAVFIAGLMVGRTPEYLGKKIESFEMKMAMLAVLILAADILLLHRPPAASATGARPRPTIPGPHGFSRDPVRLHLGDRQQRLGVRRPGRQHALLQHHARPGDADRPLPDDRAAPGASPARWSRKQRVPPSLGTFPTYGGLWVGLLVGTILIVGALTYFPALALGPIVEQLLLNAGRRSE